MALAAATATAAILNTAPAFVQIAPPASVVLNTLQSDVVLFAFNERQCFRLNYNLPTDQGFIPANTRMSSHLLHGDPFTTLLLDGRVLFDDVILGVISSSGQLDASDADCRAPGTIYPLPGNEPFRGLEAGTPDAYQILAGGLGIEARMEVPVNSFSDQIRVLTRCECAPDACPAD